MNNLIKNASVLFLIISLTFDTVSGYVSGVSVTKSIIKTNPKLNQIEQKVEDSLIYTINNNKLAFNSTSNPDVAKAVNSFNAISSKIKTPALKYIQDIINDRTLSDNDKNTYISIMIQMALGNKPVFRMAADTPHKNSFINISNLAGVKAEVDKNGNVSYAKTIIEQTIDLANKKPLDKLLQNPTFKENWKDAQNLREKSVELAKKKTLTEDEKIMWDMAEYAAYKEFPNTRKVAFMRAYLSGKLGMDYLATATDGSYMLTDDFVSRQYFEAMKAIEKQMETKKDLKPVLVRKVAKEDL